MRNSLNKKEVGIPQSLLISTICQQQDNCTSLSSSVNNIMTKEISTSNNFVSLTLFDSTKNETEKDLSNRIIISTERLTKLENLEKNLSTIILQSIEDNKQQKLQKLHEHDKLNPNAAYLRIKKYVAKNKDKINAKRREKRASQKMLSHQPTNYSVGIIEDLLNVPATNIKNEEINQDSTVVVSLPSSNGLKIGGAVTVRFD